MSHATLTARPSASADDLMTKLGRVALATQGVLYLVIGALALDLARGDGDAEASQRGALEAAARQPFGRVLLLVLLVGLLAHMGWRVALAIRGEPGDDEDGGSVAKRVANAGRAVIYAGLAVAAARILLGSGGDSGGGSEKESTATVLEWPGGRWLVIAAGLAVIGAGLWNLSKVVTATFLDDLDLSGLDRGPRRAVEGAGRVGYGARGVAFGLIGWFLVRAGLEHDPEEARGLDQSLRELATADHGPAVLAVLAVGMALFGAFRLMDARWRRPSAITHS